MLENRVLQESPDVSGNSVEMDEKVMTLDTNQAENESWVSRVLHAMGARQLKKRLFQAAKVHPCMIDGKRVLVHERSLQFKHPEAYQDLIQFAQENGFAIKEDQRQPHDSTSEPIFERRTAKTSPMFLLAGALFSQSAMVNADGLDSSHRADETRVMESVEVYGNSNIDHGRAYLVRDGKRFISGPYGEVESILSIAAYAKQNGNLKRVSTRKIKMPQTYVGGYINRYDYQFPQSCGGGKYSFYEGEGFGALGYYQGKKVILDVLVGGGPFAAPKLWGPYDQVLYDNHKMELMMGDGSNDGMGLLKASYSIGLTAVMADEDFQDYGNSYTSGVQAAMECVNNPQPQKQEPVIRQASNQKGDQSDDS